MKLITTQHPTPLLQREPAINKSEPALSYGDKRIYINMKMLVSGRADIII